MRGVQTNKCSLDRQHNPDKNGCFEDSELRKVATILGIDPSSSLEEIMESGQCEDQMCVAKILGISKQLLLLPKGPLGNEWLSDKNINDVCQQLERKFSDKFTYIGCTTSDFDSKPTLSRLKDANVNSEEFITSTGGINLDKCKPYSGIIVNTAYSNERGQHWVSLFIDKNNRIAYFFDSAGVTKSSRTFRNMIELCKQTNGIDSMMYNKKKHQYEDTECGVYSILFMCIMLGMNGKSNDPNYVYCQLLKDVDLSDSMVQASRGNIFSKD